MIKLPRTPTLRAIQLQILQILLLLTINKTLARIKIHLMRRNAPRLGDEHVSEQQRKVDRNTNVSRDELLVLELGAAVVDKHGKVLGQADEAAEEECNHGAPIPLWRGKGDCAIGEVLRVAGFDKV